MDELQEQLPRRRGRPPKIRENLEGVSDDPVEIVGDATDTKPEPKKRGRKPGSKNNGALSKESLARTLMLAHNVPAQLLQAPEWAIDKTESELLSSAIVDCLAAFDLPIDPRAEAVIGLLGACAIVYGPRVMIARGKKSQPARKGTPEIVATRQ